MLKETLYCAYCQWIVLHRLGKLLAEVAGEEAVEAGSVASLVLGHLVNGVVDGVVAELLGSCGDGELAFAGTGLGLVTLLKVGLGVPDNVTEKLCELGCVLRLFESVPLEGLRDLRIALTLGLTAHSEIHSDLRALTVEMILETLDNFLVLYTAVTDVVLAGPLWLAALILDLNELARRSVALRALCRRVLAFVNIAANQTSEFLFHNKIFFKVILKK